MMQTKHKVFRKEKKQSNIYRSNRFMFRANMKEVLLYFTNSPVYPTHYVVGA